VLGRPLGALFQVAAMALALIGAHRFWRQQMSMARGKVWASGWEIYAIMVMLVMVSSIAWTMIELKFTCADSLTRSWYRACLCCSSWSISNEMIRRRRLEAVA